MRRAAVPLLALTVAFVLADSAIVTLALPDILQKLDGTVAQVAWVLIAFNLVLAIAVVPAAWAYEGRNPAPIAATGIALFAGASALCAFSGSMEMLIGARCLQGLGGALALVGCLELLVAVTDERRGIATWVAAGVVGTAAGPVIGGLLTAAFAWEAIFIVQVPVAVLAVPAALSIRAARVHVGDARHRPALGPNLTLLLLSAALAAALFLVVLLLVDGWGHSPVVAAVAVSVVPLAALLARPLARALPTSTTVETATGCFLVAGGLVALALLPEAYVAWTIPPQALIGLGLGLTLDRLTTDAMRDRLPRSLHGGWTISARHLGVVLGLVILTPVFTADLQAAQAPVQEAITSVVLDAPISAQSKIDVAGALSDQLEQQQGQVPDLSAAFDQLDLAPAEQPAADQLESDLDDQLERAATQAFRTSFLIGAALALAALLSTVVFRRRAEA